jgi:hypothetical protein
MCGRPVAFRSSVNLILGLRPLCLKKQIKGVARKRTGRDRKVIDFPHIGRRSRNPRPWLRLLIRNYDLRMKTLSTFVIDSHRDQIAAGVVHAHWLTVGPL